MAKKYLVYGVTVFGIVGAIASFIFGMLEGNAAWWLMTYCAISLLFTITLVTAR